MIDKKAEERKREEDNAMIDRADALIEQNRREKREGEEARARHSASNFSYAEAVEALERQTP